MDGRERQRRGDRPQNLLTMSPTPPNAALPLAPTNSLQPPSLPLVRGLIEDGENPNEWTVLAVWASDGV